MHTSRPEHSNDKNVLERGQAIIEYALIVVLVGIAFGLALAASAPVTGNLFNAVVNDLLRQTLIADADLPNPDLFWGTVTGVANFTPVGGGIPTNTPANPTEVPTDGPSPTPSHTYTPSPTSPTSTPTLTRTPGDILKDAPFLDTVDEPAWWRIDSNVALGGLPWKGEFWEGAQNFSGEPAHTRNGIWEIDYNGHFIVGWPESTPGENFSARFTRTFEVMGEPRGYTFRALSDDGVRIFVDGNLVELSDANGGTGSYNYHSATLYTGAGIYDVGTHEVVVEYFQGGGGAVLKVEILGGGANPDDQGVDNTGAPSDGTFSCNWGPVEHQRNANTDFKMFDDYTNGQNRAGTLCYLEWRGAVVMPPDSTNMQLRFWDVWEFDAAGVDGWIEIAEYVAVDPDEFPPRLNRDAVNWQKIDLGRSGTANFNWTRSVIDLGPLMTGWESDKLTFRFAMQIPAGVNAARQWFIDDIEFANKTEKVFPVDRVWNLDSGEQRFDFIRTGGQSNPGTKSGWHLVSNKKYGMSGLAFHDSANDAHDSQVDIAGTSGGNYTYYKYFDGAPNTSFESDMRINALEFDGWIDLTDAPNPDSLGNSGNPVLNFYHAYDLGTRVGLYVQYSTTPYDQSPADWETFSDGVIRDVTATGNARSLAMQDYTVSLDGLPDNPPRIRIRFAMMVRADSGLGDGWWIDQIRLGRAESNKWLDYPFTDSAQYLGPMEYWRYDGTWGPVADLGHRRPDSGPDDVEISYGSSPSGNSANNTTMSMTMRWPIDLYNDTPDKTVIVEAGQTYAEDNTFGAPATEDAYLTFYHLRALGHNNDQFYVQWKRVGETDAQYKPLWAYRGRMNTNIAPEGNSRTREADKTRINLAWQYTRVSLYPVIKAIKASGGAPGVGTGDALIDDDIIIRFELRASSGGGTADVFVDDIRVGENTMRTVRLWPAAEDRRNPPSVGSTGPFLGFGSGAFFRSEPDGTTDGRRYDDDWKMGGTWQSQGFKQHSGSGLLAFHDSVVGGQDRAPTAARTPGTNNYDYGDSAWRTEIDTFSVLELDREFDLRGVIAEDEAPQLTFWSQWHIGDDDFIRVDIATWDSREDGTAAQVNAMEASMPGRCQSQTALVQCYEQERGWSQWRAVWEVGSTGGQTYSYGWRKISIDLSNYAYNRTLNDAGDKIRIRFVYDSYDNNTNADGWYIDDVQIGYRLPMPTTSINSTFIDDASSTANWIMEGEWGLDQNIYIGGASTPTNLGVWTANWWAVSGSSSFPNVATNLLNPPRPTPARTTYHTNISLNFGSGSPVAGWTQTNRIVAEFTTDVLVDGLNLQPGARSFNTRSDDGVRLKIERIDPVSGNPIPNTPTHWNVINNWTNHSTTTDSGSFVFQLGMRYRLTLQYYENSGDGIIQLSVSNGRFSFSDSPKYTGGTSPDVPPLNRSNTSLLGRRLFTLTGMDPDALPLMEIQTKYRLDGNSRARVEVSDDGGFNWYTTGLDATVGSYTFSNPVWNGRVGVNDPVSDPWQTRLFNLNSFREKHILIRFRLDRLSSVCMRDQDCNAGDAALELTNAYYDGWWIGYIRIGSQ